MVDRIVTYMGASFPFFSAYIIHGVEEGFRQNPKVMLFVVT